ncbi:competence protein CoiA family protein [Halobacillus rhizosphaerae]|uniref:competence protein CoiA n=1 Tax=Halobacillus rhizosphaerae TaxID=3064889 RepID=UPI00398AD9D2
MFYALNQNGKRCSLYHLPKSHLEKLKLEEFHCPVCKEAVHIRSGPKVTAHFAHYAKSDCETLTGGEGVYHESGKWLLYQWLNSQNYSVHLEHYISSINQRPDIWLSYKQRKIAIEFQCSRVPIKVIESRTRAYQKHGIFPFWIIGCNQFERQGRQGFKWNQFLQSFLYKFHDSLHLFFFDVHSQRFIICHSIQTLSNRKAFHHPFIISLSELSFPQLFTPRANSTYSLFQRWERLMYTYRTTPQNSLHQKEHQFRQYLYLKGIYSSLIPAVCFLPVRGQSLLDIQPYMWQTRLLLDHFHEKSIGDRGRFPQNRVKGLTGFTLNPIQEYEQLLSQLGFLELNSQGGWVKKKELIFPKHIDEALKDDKNILKLLKNNKNYNN